MLTLLPGSPDSAVMATFGALPASASVRFCSLDFVISSAPTLFTTAPSFSFVVIVPSPVMMSCCSTTACDSRAKSVLIAPGLSVTVADFGLNPCRRTVSLAVCPVARAAGMVKR